MPKDVALSIDAMAERQEHGKADIPNDVTISLDESEYETDDDQQ